MTLPTPIAGQTDLLISPEDGTSAFGSEFTPRVAAIPGGGFLAIWRDTLPRTEGTAPEGYPYAIDPDGQFTLMFRIFDAAGQPVAPAAPVSDDFVGGMDGVGVATLANGTVLVGIQAGGAFGQGSGRLTAVILDPATGERVAPEVTLATSDGEPFEWPTHFNTLALPDGSGVVVSLQYVGDVEQMRTTVIGNDGTVGASAIITLPPGAFPGTPGQVDDRTVALLGANAGTLAFVTREGTGPSSITGVFFVRVDGSDAGLDYIRLPLRLNDAVVEAMADGGVVVGGAIPGDGVTTEYRLFRFDASGEPVPGWPAEASFEGGIFGGLDLLALPDGGLLLATSLVPEAGVSDSELAGQRIRVDGTLDGGPFAINTPAARFQTRPHLALAENGDVVVVWEDDRSLANPEIRAARLDLGLPAAPIIGTAGADTLEGTERGERIEGLGGEDLLRGGGGNDTLFGGGAFDALFGGDGDDRLLGGDGLDYLNGGDGNDVLLPGSGGGQLIGGAGDDTLNASANADGQVLMGEDGDDVIIGGSGEDSIDGGAGADRILGQGGIDRGSGGAGNDTMLGGDGADSLWGGDDSDRMLGGDGDDLLDGEGGNDTLIGGSGEDTLLGGAGEDLLNGVGGALFLYGGEGNDTIHGGAGPHDQVLRGDAGDDVLLAGGGQDSLQGGDGQDRMLAGSGDDSAFGDAGRDTILGGDGADTLDGGADADRLLGDSGDDSLSGGAGDDRILGGAGDDVIFGGLGADLLTGGSGADSFVYYLDGDTGDVIADFEQGVDRLNVSNIQALDPVDFLGTGAFTGTTGEVRFTILGDTTLVELDGLDPDAEADASFTLLGAYTLTAQDFIL